MPFAALASALKTIDIDILMSEAFTAQNLQEWVKQTIRQRLLNDGITGGEKKLQTDRSKQQGTTAYSMLTERLRGLKGKQTDHVDLFDEGDLHRSLKILIKQEGFETSFNWENSKYSSDIFVNFTESYSNPEEFYNDVESLTPDELAEIGNKIYLYVEQKLNATLSI